MELGFTFSHHHRMITLYFNYWCIILFIHPIILKNRPNIFSIPQKIAWIIILPLKIRMFPFCLFMSSKFNQFAPANCVGTSYHFGVRECQRGANLAWRVNWLSLNNMNGQNKKHPNLEGQNDNLCQLWGTKNILRDLKYSLIRNIDIFKTCSTYLFVMII